MNSASREQRTTVMTDASGPKAPPVISSGPQTVGSNTLAVFAEPETLKPNTFPWVKFQAQWIPMGSHREPEYLKAPPQQDTCLYGYSYGAPYGCIGLEEMGEAKQESRDSQSPPQAEPLVYHSEQDSPEDKFLRTSHIQEVE